jgi:hypothetical protein
MMRRGSNLSKPETAMLSTSGMNSKDKDNELVSPTNSIPNGDSKSLPAAAEESLIEKTPEKSIGSLEILKIESKPVTKVETQGPVLDAMDVDTQSN